MKPGYYRVGDEVYYISGKKIGNRYYTIGADCPRWAVIAHAYMPSDEYFVGAIFTEQDPLKGAEYL